MDEERRWDRCVNVDKHQVHEETFFLPQGDKDDGDAKLDVVWNEIYFLYKIKLRNQKFRERQKNTSTWLMYRTAYTHYTFWCVSVLSTNVWD